MIFERRSIIILIVGLLITAALAIAFAFPQLASKRKAEASLRTQQQQVREIEARIEQLQVGGDKQIEDLQTGVARADAILPTSVNLSTVFTTVPQLALQSGVTLLNFTPGAAQPGPATVPTLMFVGYETQATGSLPALQSWVESFQSAQDSGLLLTISNPVLAVGDQAGASYSLRFTLQAWYSTTPSLASQSAGGAPVPGATPAPVATPTP